ncbi:MAG: ATP-binding protein [Bacteroidetes bacterium]|nr:ATP-binding protein [Bacteroidota bacterium]MDA1118927.1 ATP-binding protein [Bacteroidota bacterium]
MLLNSRALALLLALSISTITTLFLSLVPEVETKELVITALLSFSSDYLLTYIILEFLFFKEIREIYGALDKLNKRDYLLVDKKPIKKSFKPFTKVNQELKSYVKVKQEEIEKLKKLEVFRREFVADVSHELKTPIFAAQGFVHTLLDGAIADKSVRMKFLKKAAKSLDRLDVLVQDLMTISHMETGAIKMHFEDFDLVELVDEVIDQLENKAGKRGIKLIYKKGVNQSVRVHGDPQRIYQVMINLVSNAIESIKKKNGQVEINIRENQNDVTISIRDDGRGIPPEDINRIFERFYRVEKSRSREKGGTGLGLAIVKHILEGHGSNVEVSSTIKQGSIFSFKLKKGKLLNN